MYHTKPVALVRTLVLARRRPREDSVVGGLPAHVCNGIPQVALCTDCPPRYR